MTASSQARQPEQIDKPAGSPKNGEPVFLVVGKLRKPHGLHGEMRMEVITDFPERLKPGVTVFVGADHRPLRIHSRRWHNQLLLIAFDGFSDPGAVGIFRNWLVYVRADDRPPLPEGDYYHHQLIGLQVIDDRDEPLGQLAEILETGANNVYIVRPLAGPDLLIPAIDEVITQVDLDAGVMRVQLLPGLKLE